MIERVEGIHAEQVIKVLLNVECATEGGVKIEGVWPGQRVSADVAEDACRLPLECCRIDPLLRRLRFGTRDRLGNATRCNWRCVRISSKTHVGLKKAWGCIWSCRHHRRSRWRFSTGRCLGSEDRATAADWLKRCFPQCKRRG